MHDTLPHRLRDAADRLGPEPVTVAALADACGGALQGTLLVLLATPCVLPVPGIGNVMGAALVMLGLAMWRGERADVLPARVAAVTMPARWGARVLRLIARFHEFAGRAMRTRLVPLAVVRRGGWLAPKVVLMGALIFLPIPLGNVLPAVSMVLTGLGLVRRDGLAVLVGAVFGAAAVAWTAALGVGAWAWIARPVLEALGA
ncbi:MAG: exopolysaccharide biosynthesis protein [Burkholderiales bacterium]